MANIIKIKRGSSVPGTSDLANYELGYRTGTEELYINDGGQIRQVGSGGSGGGAVDSISNFADNRVLTASDADSIRGEGNLTFDGTTLAITGALTTTSTLNITGTATLQSYLDFSGTDNRINNTTNDLKIVQYANDKDIIFYNDDGSGGVTPYLTLDGSATTVNVAKNMLFPDSVEIKMGNGPDFDMSHDGSNSYIRNWTGGLFIDQNVDDSDITFRCDDGSGGITTYLTLDGSTVKTDFKKPISVEDSGFFADSSVLYFGTGNDLRIQHNGSNSFIQQYGTGDLYIDQTIDDKDIIFRCDDGSGGTTPYLTLDGSAGNLNFNNKALVAIGGIYGNSGTLNMYNNTYYFKNSTSGIIMSLNGHTLDLPNTGDWSYILNNTNSGGLRFGSKDSGGTLAYQIETSNTGNYVKLNENVQLPATKKLYFDGGGHTYFTETSNDLLDLYVGGALLMRFEESGTDSVFTNDNVRLGVGVHKDLVMYHTSGASYVKNTTGRLSFEQTAQDEDIRFSVNDGGSTTNLLTLNSASSRIGIGTTAPADHVHIYGTSGTTQLRIETTADAGAQIRYKNDAQSFIAGINLNNQYTWYSSQLSATTNMIHSNGDFYTYYDFLISTNNRALEGRDTAGNITNLIKIDNQNAIRLGDTTHVDQIAISTSSTTNAMIFSTSGTIALNGNVTMSSPFTVNYGAVINEGGNNSDTRIESVGNTHMFKVDADTNRVGIGTGSPGYTLDVSGTGRFTADLRCEGRYLSAPGSASAPAYSFYSDGDLGMYRLGDDALGFSVGGNLGMQLTSAHALRIYQSDDTTDFMEFYANDTTAYYHHAHGDNHQFITDHGYIQLGPENDGWGHIRTDRNKFYFNKSITVDSGIVAAYDEDLQLRYREGSSSNRIDVANGYTRIIAGNGEKFRVSSDGRVNYNGWTGVDHITVRSNGHTNSGSSSTFYIKFCTVVVDNSPSDYNGLNLSGTLYNGDNAHGNTIDWSVWFNNALDSAQVAHGGYMMSKGAHWISNILVQRTGGDGEVDNGTCTYELYYDLNLGWANNFYNVATEVHYSSQGKFNVTWNHDQSEVTSLPGTQVVNVVSSTYDDSNQTLVPTGSPGSPAYSFFAQRNTGMYGFTDNTIGFSNNGTRMLSIKADGNLELRNDGSSQGASIQRVGGIQFTWDRDSYGTDNIHSIRTDSDDIILSSYDDVTINLDSNNNDNASTFDIRQHSSTKTGGELLFQVNQSGISYTMGASQVGNGSAAAPTLSFYNDTDTGFYRKAANQIGFSTAGEEQMYLADGSLHIAQPVRFQFANDQRIYDDGGGGLAVGSQWNGLTLFGGTNNGIINFKDGGRNGTVRATISGGGVYKWGSGAAHGQLTWDTGKAILSSLSGNTLELRSQNTSDMIAIENNVIRFIADGTERFRASQNGLDLSNNSATKIVHNSNSSRDKIRVWTSSNYAIGMQSGFTFGGLNSYAMTFNMNNQNDRGFWWGDDSHGQGNGAMALTTNGKLTVAHSARIGYGESDTTTPGTTKLEIGGVPDGRTITFDQSGRINGLGSYFSSNAVDSQLWFYCSDGGTNGDTNIKMKVFADGRLKLLSADGSEMLLAKATRWGYSSGYKALIIGETSGNYTTSFGYDPNTNASAQFTGDGRELIFRNGAEFMTPNSANNGFHNDVMVLKDGVACFGHTSPWTSTKLDLGATSSNMRTGAKIYFYDSNRYIGRNGSNIDYYSSSGIHNFTGTIQSSADIIANKIYVKHGGSDYSPNISFLGGSDTAGSNTYENAIIGYYDASGTGNMLFKGNRGAMNWHFNDSDETLFLMASDGDFHAHQDVVAYSTSAASDKKFKENIKTIPYGLEEVLQMNPVEYDWKEKRNKAHDIGVIAQEIEKIIPEVVKESKELNSDETFKSVDYGKMVAVLIRAVQEQQVQIDELKTKLGE